jgi:hypothetical protein
MSGWPTFPEQCPVCRYFEPFEPPCLDDRGYEIVGFCANPRIGMELFTSKRDDAARGICPLFQRQRAE